MQKKQAVQIRFIPSHGLLVSRAGHPVRTATERAVCEWLTEHGFEHRHSSEVYIIKAPTNGSPTLFVPDIVLTEKRTMDGRTVIIETLHSFAPKRGGLRAFAAFCKQYRDDFYTILVVRKSILGSIPRQPCNVRLSLENLDLLEKKLEKEIAPEGAQRTP